MIEYQDTPSQNYVDLGREDRIQRINQALFHLVSAANILVAAAEAELADGTHEDEKVSENDQANFRLIGANLRHLSKISSETNAIIEDTLDAGVELPGLPELPESPTLPELPETPELPELLEAPALPIEPEAPEQPEAAQAVRAEAPRRAKTKPRRPTPKRTPKKGAPAKQEKQPARGSSRFYSRIVAAEEIPPIELDEAANPLLIHIASDDTITLNGKEVTLGGDRLFVFNAFMMLRDKSTITANDIRMLGFRLEPSDAATVTLSRAIKQVCRYFQDEAGADSDGLIARQGEGGHVSYRVNPAVVITDFVREGSTVTVDFLDEGDDSLQTFRVANRYKQHSPDSSIKLLSSDLPLTVKLLGAKRNEIVKYTNNNGEALKLKVVGIE
jgi:hypothetical protein